MRVLFSTTNKHKIREANEIGKFFLRFTFFFFLNAFFKTAKVLKIHERSERISFPKRKRFKSRVLFSTTNKHKIREANETGKIYGIEFEQVIINYPEIRNDKFENIASDGVKYVYEKINRQVIVEDSGIIIDALNGFPGTFSAYVEKKLGNKGILNLMRDVEEQNRTARYISVVAFFDGKILKTFVGTVDGKISTEERGSGGFGYDPVFIPDGYKETFGENPEPKKEISHRRKSVEEFCKFYAKYNSREI